MKSDPVPGPQPGEDVHAEVRALLKAGPKELDAKGMYLWASELVLAERRRIVGSEDPAITVQALAERVRVLEAYHSAAEAYLEEDVCDCDTTAEMWATWQGVIAARAALASAGAGETP